MSVDQGVNKFSSWALVVPKSTITTMVNGQNVTISGFACGKPCAKYPDCGTPCLKHHDLMVTDPVGFASDFLPASKEDQTSPNRLIHVISRHLFQGELALDEVA